MKMTKDLDLMLIRLVKSMPILYDKTKFSNYNEREVAWQKIGDQLHRPSLECKDRWMNMREFFRSTTLKTIGNKSDGRSTKRKPYKYHNELLFLAPHYKDGVVSIGDLENPTDEADATNVPKEEDDPHDDFTFEVDNPGTPDVINDVDNLKEDYSDTKEDDNVVNDLSEDTNGGIELENFASKMHKLKSKRKRKIRVHNDYKYFQETNAIVELNPSDSADNFLIDIRSKMKKLSRSKKDKVKSKIYSIMSQYE